MQEYADFLGRQSPYDRLDSDDLRLLARNVEVEFFGPGETIVHAEGPQLDHLYVVRTGTVHVVDRGAVVDELSSGDTFGQISLLSGLRPPLSVVASTETLCYRLPDPRVILRHPERLAFAHYNTMVSRPQVTSMAGGLSRRPIRSYMREVLWCEPDSPIKTAAAAMTAQNQSCVLYETPRGYGIMTDSDCRRQVATGRISPHASVATIGTVPARCVGAEVAAADGFVEMVTHGVHHLVVVNEAGRAVGVVRVVDLSSAEIRNPLSIRRAIDEAADVPSLARASKLLGPTAVELFDAGIPAERAGALVGAVVEAIVERCVRLEAEEQPEADVAHSSWMVLGSLARREPLPCSDVDTAVVHADALAPERGAALDSAERVIQLFERCGLRRCPDGANASNPLFNRTRQAWVAAAERWITDPDQEGALLLSSIVADSRPITNVPLGRSFGDQMTRMATNTRFLKRMLDESLSSRPPTGFVRDFVVEANGQHRGELNLKNRGIGPVVAIGRWIAITLRLPASSTADRLEQGRNAGLLTRDEADTLRGAHQEMFEMLFEREVEALRSSRPVSTYLNPEQLDTLTRRHLRESFRAIAKVQTRLEGEWLSRLRQ